MQLDDPITNMWFMVTIHNFKEVLSKRIPPDMTEEQAKNIIKSHLVILATGIAIGLGEPPTPEVRLKTITTVLNAIKMTKEEAEEMKKKIIKTNKIIVSTPLDF